MTDDLEPGADALSVTELIALGRDREAVVLATQPAPRQPAHSSTTRTTERGAPMDGAQQLDEIIPLLEGLVDEISPEQLDDPTPCASFTVAGVLEHMIGGATIFSPAFRGEAPTAAADGAAAGPLVDRWRGAMADLLGAVHSPGAQERTIASPFGDVPGSTFARYVAFDGLVHGWDLATSIGQDYSPRPELVAEVDAFARELLRPEMRDGDTFAAETDAPADASALERLVAFSGRKLHIKEGQR